jgi:hypothetical protein
MKSKLIAALAVLATASPNLKAQLKINESQLYLSPIVIGSNNNVNINRTNNTQNTTNYYNSFYSSPTKDLLELTNFISEKTAETAKEVGDHRLSASVYRAQLNALKKQNLEPTTYEEIYLKIAHEEAKFDAQAAIKTLLEAYAATHSPSILIDSIKEQLRWGFLKEAKENLEILESHKNLSSNNLYLKSLFRQIYFIKTEQNTKAKEKFDQLQKEYLNTSETEQRTNAQDHAYALISKTLIDARTTTTPKFETSALHNHLKKHFKENGEIYLLNGFGPYSLRTSDGVLVEKIKTSTPLKPAHPSQSVSDYILAPERAIYNYTAKFIDDFHSQREAATPNQLRHFIEERVQKIDANFTECQGCPLSTLAKQYVWRFASLLNVDHNNHEEAYYAATRSRFFLTKLIAELGENPKTLFLSAESSELIGNIRNNSNNGITDPFLPSQDLASYYASINSIIKIESLNERTNELSTKKAQIYYKIAQEFNNRNQSTPANAFCKLAADTADTLIENRIYNSQIEDVYLSCTGGELILYFATNNDALFKIKANKYINYIESNKVNLSELGKKLIAEFKERLKEISEKEEKQNQSNPVVLPQGVTG